LNTREIKQSHTRQRTTQRRTQTTKSSRKLKSIVFNYLGVQSSQS